VEEVEVVVVMEVVVVDIVVLRFVLFCLDDKFEDVRLLVFEVDFMRSL